jgi:Tol biopolymer transport system component
MSGTDRWARVEALYHAAWTREASERAAFLDEACAGDAELRREVESLLAQPATGDGVMDTPALAAAARLITQPTPSLTGRRLGVYAIQELLGAGGMGEVYRARDTTLGRDVAIKILPHVFSTDPDRRARFEREARMLAALNHPHIGAIYGVEDSGGLRALVLELVEGETLADRLAHGPMPLTEALLVASQIADALDAAHEKGIVHRDLKPANIKIAPDGTVKVLDFGLAKAAVGDGSGPDLTQSPTGSIGGTRDGVILGTAAYMSPEQARGKAIDKRTDVWAFGCVLYEMLTGRAAFAGDTLSDTIAAILSREPDWSALPGVTPAPIRRLLIRCMDKEARRRLRDIGDARTETEDVLSGTATLAQTTSAIAPTPISDAQMAAALVRQNRGRLALAVALVLTPFAGFLLRRPAAPEAAFRENEINPPEDYSFAPLMEGGAPALSPDGTKIAFVAQDGAGRRSLWFQSLDAFDAHQLTGTDGAAAPFWSPDSGALAFFAYGALKTVTLDGGAPQTLAPWERFGSQGALPGTWSGDETLLWQRSDLRLWSVSSKGGEPAPATERIPAAMESDHYGAFFLPDGRHFIVLVRRGAELRLEVMLAELGSNARKPLLSDVAIAQYAPGRNGRSSHLIFVRGGKLLAQPFDDDRLELTGSERRLAQNVAVTFGGGLADFSVSAGGVLAYRNAATAPQEEMVFYDRRGNKVGTIGNRRGHPRNIIRISPSGKVAFTRQGPTTQEVWFVDVGSGHPEILTDNGRSPVWSPDESEIAFLRENERDESDPPTYTIYRKKVDRSAQEVPVWKGAGIIAINDWSGDGQYLLLTLFDTTKPGTEVLLLQNPLNPSTPPEPVRFETKERADHAQFVPSRGRPPFAITITMQGVVVRGVPWAERGPWQFGSEGAFNPRWRQDGLELFFIDGGYMHAVERVESATDFKFRGQPDPLFELPSAFKVAGGQVVPAWDVTPDGKRFLVMNPPPDVPGSIKIVHNWDVE